MASGKRHTKAKGLARILRENGWTPEFMQAEWDRAVRALEDGCTATTFRYFVNNGDNWDTVPTQLLPSLVGLADKMYASKAKADAERAEAEARRQAEEDARDHYEDHVEEVLVGKIDAGEELSEWEIRDFLDAVEHYDEEEGGDRRWSRPVTTYCRTGDGRFFRVAWEKGLTEKQENSYPDQPVEVTLHEEEKVITVIERTWAEVGAPA